MVEAPRGVVDGTERELDREAALKCLALHHGINAAFRELPQDEVGKGKGVWGGPSRP